MSPTDILDVSGATYTYLINGQPPAANWTALFRLGERVRLRFINGSSMSIFDVHIPDLQMTVIQADGNDVVPVTVDEFRIGVAETYDVIVQPRRTAPTRFSRKPRTAPALPAARWHRVLAWRRRPADRSAPAAHHDGYGHGRNGRDGHGLDGRDAHGSTARWAMAACTGMSGAAGACRGMPGMDGMAEKCCGRASGDGRGGQCRRDADGAPEIRAG